MGCYTSKPCIYLSSSSPPTSSTPTSSPFHSSYTLDIINLATKWIHVFLKNENQHLTDSLALHLKQFIAKTLYIVTTSIYNKKLIDFKGREKEVFQILKKFNKQNLHKMNPIPIYKVPEILK